MPGQKTVCSSLAVKICSKEIWQAHLTSRDGAKPLRFQKIQTAVLKDTITQAKLTQVTSDLVKLKNARINNIKAQKEAFKVDKTYFKLERTFDRQVSSKSFKISIRCKKYNLF